MCNIVLPTVPILYNLCIDITSLLHWPQNESVFFWNVTEYYLLIHWSEKFFLYLSENRYWTFQ